MFCIINLIITSIILAITFTVLFLFYRETAFPYEKLLIGIIIIVLEEVFLKLSEFYEPDRVHFFREIKDI